MTMDSADERVLVFEDGGYAYVFDDLRMASEFAESIDVVDDLYVGAFRADGRVIRIVPTDDIYADLELTEAYDLPALNALVRGCRVPRYRAGENIAEFTDRCLVAERRPRERWSLGRIWARMHGRVQGDGSG